MDAYNDRPVSMNVCIRRNQQGYSYTRTVQFLVQISLKMWKDLKRGCTDACSLLSCLVLGQNVITKPFIHVSNINIVPIKRFMTLTPLTSLDCHIDQFCKKTLHKCVIALNDNVSCAYVVCVIKWEASNYALKHWFLELSWFTLDVNCDYKSSSLEWCSTHNLKSLWLCVS